MISKLRTVCDMLGEFWAHIAFFGLCRCDAMQPICTKKFTRLITDTPDPNDQQNFLEGEVTLPYYTSPHVHVKDKKMCDMMAITRGGFCSLP